MAIFASAVRLAQDLFRDGRAATLLSVFTPAQSSHRPAPVRWMLAGGALAVFGLATAAAATGAALMLLAAGIIYYLMTQVLGLRLELDPQAIFQPASRQPSTSSAPN